MGEILVSSAWEASNASAQPQSQYIYMVRRDYDFPDDSSCLIIGIYKSQEDAREKWQLTIGKIIDQWDGIEDKDQTTITKNASLFRLYDDNNGYLDEVSIVRMELK